MGKTRRMSVVIGRVTVDPGLEIHFMSAEQILRGIFENWHVIIDETRVQWAFADITTVGKVIAGRLVQINPEQAPVFRDFQLVSEDILQAADYSNFALKPETELIAFEERPGIVTIKQFCSYFRALCIKIEPRLRWLSVEPLVVSNQLVENVRRFKSIDHATFNLVPANPDDRPEFQILDREIKKMRASKVRLDISAPRAPGINLEGTLAGQAISMVSHGYGDCSLSGSDQEGRDLKVKSRDFIIRRRIEASDHPFEYGAQFEDLLHEVEGTLST